MSATPPDDSSPSLTRRGFLHSALAAAAATTTPAALAEAAARAPEGAPAVQAPQAPPRPVQLNINGKDHRLALEPRVTLLDALREHLGLTGSKKGCDHGQCGACTVLVNGRRINSCLTLAVMHDGDGSPPSRACARRRAAPAAGGLHRARRLPVRLLHAGADLLGARPARRSRGGHGQRRHADRAQSPVALTDDEIRERMSGNLCRCGAYPNIVDAVAHVAAKA